MAGFRSASRSKAPRGRILRLPSPQKMTGVGMPLSSDAATSASRGLAGYSSVLGGAEPAAIEDAAHHTPLGAHLRRRRFPLLLWRRGAGRGGRRSQLARNILVQQPAGMSPRPTESRRVMGLLSPTLSSKGGEGEPRARCLHPMRVRCGKYGRTPVAPPGRARPTPGQLPCQSYLSSRWVAASTAKT